MIQLLFIPRIFHMWEPRLAIINKSISMMIGKIKTIVYHYQRKVNSSSNMRFLLKLKLSRTYLWIQNSYKSSENGTLILVGVVRGF